MATSRQRERSARSLNAYSESIAAVRACQCHLTKLVDGRINTAAAAPEHWNFDLTNQTIAFWG
jgi:hypothetical protein